jgi:predicted HTH transcriptional regulator
LKHGAGIEKINAACVSVGKSLPVFKATLTEIADAFATGLKNNAEINEVDQKILAVLRTNPESIMSAIAITLDMASRSAEYRLNRLKKFNLIERIGAKKNGKWLVR